MANRPRHRQRWPSSKLRSPGYVRNWPARRWGTTSKKPVAYFAEVAPQGTHPRRQRLPSGGEVAGAADLARHATALSASGCPRGVYAYERLRVASRVAHDGVSRQAAGTRRVHAGSQAQGFATGLDNTGPLRRRMGALRPATALPCHGPGRRLQPHTAGSKEPAVPGIRCKRAGPGTADCHRPHGGEQGMAGRSEGSLQRRDLGLGIGRCAGRSGSQVKCCLPWTRSTSRREHRSTTGDTRRRPELGSQVAPSIASGSTSSTTTGAGKAGRATWRQRPSRDKTSPMRACECSNNRSPFVPLVRTSPRLAAS